MDLGIRGRSAIVCASTKGLGLACAQALAAAGVATVVNGRDREAVERAVGRLQAATGGEVRGVCADLCLDEGRRRLLDACPAPDILVTNNGGPPPRGVADLRREDLTAAIEMNLLAAAELISAVAPAMAQRRFGRVVNITSVAVARPIEGLAASSVARAGLTALSAAAARAHAAANVTFNCIEPGFFATDRVVGLAGGREAASVAVRFGVEIPAARLGRPEELGALCAFLCSEHAGYITGQRFLIDGGLVGRI